MDNEQYRLRVASRWRVELEGGEGFRAIHRLLGPAVEYRRRDAFALGRLEERFDFVCWSAFCIGSRIQSGCCASGLRGRTVDRRTVLVETYGVGAEDRNGPAIRVSEPRKVYARDEFVYRGFGDADLQRIARIPGFSRVESLVNVAGRRPPAHHRSASRLEAPGRRSQQPLHQTTISGRYCRSGFVELSGSSCAPIRARSDWRFGAARLLSC